MASEAHNRPITFHRAHEVHTEGQALLSCVDAPLDLASLYQDVELERA